MSKKRFIFLMSSVVLIGFLGGVVGELWVNSFLLPEPYLNFKTFSDLSKRIDDLVKNQEDVKRRSSADNYLIDTVSKIKSVVVDLYRFKDQGNSVTIGFLPQEKIATAVTITNDGWLIAPASLLKGLNKVSVLLADGAILVSEKIIFPPNSSVAFIKIDKNGLNVANFDSRRGVADGETVFLSTMDGFVINNIKNRAYSVRGTEKELLRTSENFYKKIILDSSMGKVVSGVPVFTGEGRLLGFSENTEGQILSVDSFASLMKETVKGSDWYRPYLGIKFLDLQEFVSFKTKERKGVLIVENGINKNSPAWGKLESGDIIIRVEGEELNDSKSLPEILADYSVGTSLKFLVKRDSQEVEIIVELVQELK